MNAWVAPSCVGCFFHSRCENCHVEQHKVRALREEALSRPYLLVEAPRRKKNAGKDTAGPDNPSEDFKARLMPSSDDQPLLSSGDSSIPLPHQWNSYTISSIIAFEQLQRRQLQDIFLTELSPDAEFSEITDKSTLSWQSPANAASNKEHHDEQTSSEDATPSSGHTTPSSEGLEYWEENLDSEGCDVDTEILLEIFRSPLDTLFQEWLAEVKCHGDERDKNPSPSSSIAARSIGHQQPRSKRKRGDNEEDEENDSEPNKLRSAQKRPRKQMSLDKLLACPYSKKDARHHTLCRVFGGKKLSYVKSHIYRKHTIAMYCPVCHETFDNMQLRDSHSRQRNCEPLENPRTPDGITSEQRDWLGRRGPRGLNEEQQWFRMFDFLFPGHPLPHSAYNDTEFSEDVLNFNDYITSPTGPEVLLERVRDNPLWTAEIEAGLREDIEHGLGQFYWRWAPAATDRSDIGQTPAIESPSREPGASSQSTVEDASSAGINSETRLAGNNASPVVEATGTVVGPPDNAEPPLESSLPFADFELEERKVDEEDQMPARQLNHEGIAPILDQAAWAPEGLSGSDDIVYDPLSSALPNGLHYENPQFDALLNPLDDIEIAGLWAGNPDLLGYTEDASLGSTGSFRADDFLSDLGVNATGGTVVWFNDKK